MGSQTREALERFKAHVASIDYVEDEAAFGPLVGASITLLHDLAFSLDSVRNAPRRQSESLSEFQDRQSQEWNKIKQRREARKPATSTDDFLV